MSCPLHGSGNEDYLAELNDVMRHIPESQADEGRHKCVYCAYEEGRRRGREEARQEVFDKIRDFLG